MLPLITQDTRVLRPEEYEQLRSILKPDFRYQLDGLLFSGMRYVEAVRFQKNPQWFDNGFIMLPKGSMLKVKAKQKDRTVWLSKLGKKKVPLFLKSDARLPARQWFDPRIKIWAEESGLDPKELSAKSLRKTWESWLVATYPNNLTQIA